MAEWLKAHAWKACGHLRVSWVRIPPRPLVVEVEDHYDVAGRARRLVGESARSVRFLCSRCSSALKLEGWQNGNAPVSKTGALTGLGVRIPPPPYRF